MQKHMAASASNAAEVLEVLTALFTGNMRSLQSSSFSRARRLSALVLTTRHLHLAAVRVITRLRPKAAMMISAACAKLMT